MRLLSDAEIAAVAGGGLNDLVIRATSLLTGDHTFIQSNGRIFADYAHDGIYDVAWQPDANCPGGWSQSYTGNQWFCGTNAGDEMIDWELRHSSWNASAADGH